MIIFNMSMSYFHKISFHYFEYYLMTKLTLVKQTLAHVGDSLKKLARDKN